MEAKHKRPGGEVSEEKGAKRRRDLEVEGEKNDDIWGWLCKEDEETLDELMKLLKSDDKNWPLVPESASTTSTGKVRFICDPYSPQSIFQTTSSSYVTINGNEESCGSSYSDFGSSVMVSIDMRGGGYGNGILGENEVLGSGSGSDLGLEGLEWELAFEKWLVLGGFVVKEKSGGAGGACGGTEEKALGGDGVEEGWDDAALARFIGEDLD